MLLWLRRAMKARVITIILLLSVVILNGCFSIHPSQRTVSQWIPLDTPQEDAIRIMKQHGFESGRCGNQWRQPKGEADFCFWHETKILKNSCSFFVHFKDGKVVSVSRPVTGNDFFDFLYREQPNPAAASLARTLSCRRLNHRREVAGRDCWAL